MVLGVGWDDRQASQQEYDSNESRDDDIISIAVERVRRVIRVDDGLGCRPLLHELDQGGMKWRAAGTSVSRCSLRFAGNTTISQGHPRQDTDFCFLINFSSYLSKVTG